MTQVATDDPTPSPFDHWRREIRRPTPLRNAALLALVVGAAALIMLLARRPGHWWGDDWALYLRQAEGLLDGDPGRIAAENRFTLEFTPGAQFSPPMYPWGFPLVLVPFVALFDTDLDAIALVSTFAACVFACCWYALARPRIGDLAALLGAFAVVTTPVLLLWTELIQSEWTFLAAVGVVFVGLDRVIASGGLTDTSRSVLPLVALGIGAAAAFSVRREGFALTPAIATAQIVALHATGEVRERLFDRKGPRLVARLLAPHAAALTVVLGLVVALPSTLVPSYDGTSVTNVIRFAGDHVENVAQVSGLKSPWDTSPAVLGSHAAGWAAVVVYLVLGGLGVVLALTVHRRRDAQFVCYLVVALAIGGSFRAPLDRYVASIGPILVLLGLVALTWVARWIRRRELRPLVVLPLLVLLVIGNVTQAIDRIDATDSFEQAGLVEWGPLHPDALAMYDQVRARTDDDAVIGAPKARAMTWATGRRSVQVGNGWQVPPGLDLDLIAIETDDGLRPELDADEGWTITWRGRRFVLYQPVDE